MCACVCVRACVCCVCVMLCAVCVCDVVCCVCVYVCVCVYACMCVCVMCACACVCVQAISSVKQRLLDYRKKFRATLSNHSLDYVTVSGDQVSTIIMHACLRDCAVLVRVCSTGESMQYW